MFHFEHQQSCACAYAEDPDAIATLIQQAAGEMARDYNRRKGPSGAFWEGRYHATMVGSGEYLWECVVYERQAKRTQAIAVGERTFVEAIEDQIKTRRHMVVSEVSCGAIFEALPALA